MDEKQKYLKDLSSRLLSVSCLESREIAPGLSEPETFFNIHVVIPHPRAASLIMG